MSKNIYNKKNSFKIIYIIMQVIFLAILYFVSDNLLYSSYIKDLFILIILLMLIVIPLGFMSYGLYKEKKKNFINLFILIINFVCLFFCMNYMIKSIRAFRYENSYEVYKLNNIFSIKEAKKIKKNIEVIFENDFDNILSRDVIIDNFYYDDDDNSYVLYLNDYYDNYRLKFFVQLDKYEIIDVYWQYNDIKFYLVTNGTKSDNFEYLYAMYIISETIGEELSKVTTIEADIEKKIVDRYKNATNSIIVYDGLFYDDENDQFYLSCQVANMDFYGNTIENKFNVLFYRKNKNIKKTTWYYGDSSFDYVQWNVKF